MLSQSVEDYLKAIYKLESGDPVSTTDIANALGVSSASVTNMIKRLAQMELVEYQSYKGVRLTETGLRNALETIRHHRLLETFLREKLGYSWAELHEEAERLEHHISESFERKIDDLLGHPTHDPHGHPIPTRDLTITETQTVPLSSVEVGVTVIVQQVSDTDPELLGFLEEIGLLPRTSAVVTLKEPFNGPITVRVGDETRIVGHEVADSVFVTPL